MVFLKRVLGSWHLDVPLMVAANLVKSESTSMPPAPTAFKGLKGPTDNAFGDQLEAAGVLKEYLCVHSDVVDVKT